MTKRVRQSALVRSHPQLLLASRRYGSMSAPTMRRLVRDRAIPTTLAVVTALSFVFASSASAALTDVDVGPSNGPVGTTVTVSGSACLPGLLINPSHAGVLVLTLGVSIDVVVPPNGAWSVQFDVPPGALPGAHAIVA